MSENIILKTIKEVEFFNTRTSLEIFAKEKNAYVILSEYKIFDIDNLKNYLIENDLNQFAKNEINNLIDVIASFSKLYSKWRELPISENFYHYKNENNGIVSFSGWGSLVYILHRNNTFMKINEMRFRENHTPDLIYTSLVNSTISRKLNEIRELFVDFIEPENFTPDEVYKTQNLFKVGLLFATGKMNEYITINNLNEIVLNKELSPLKIANKLGNKSFEKYILASKNNYKTGENKSKNIFNNFEMMTKIIDHCKANNLPIDSYFVKRLPTE